MANVLIVFCSRTGNTKAMAETIAESAREAGAKVTVKSTKDTDVAELQKADAIILGSPTYYGHSSGEMRTFIDATVKLHGRLEGKVGAAFTSSHNIAGGNETAIMDMLEALIIHGMIVQGNAKGSHYGPVAVGSPDDRATGECRELGRNVVALLRRLGVQ